MEASTSSYVNLVERMKKVHVLHDVSGNWHGIYVDGILASENHRKPDVDLLKRLSKSLDIEVTYETLSLKALGHTCCPYNLKNLLSWEPSVPESSS